jgi:hypothetical protein
MTRKRGWILGAVAMAATVLVACSSSSGSGSNTSCVEGSAPNEACYSCAQSNCGSQLSAFESDCSTYLSCVCPGGSYSSTAAASMACAADVTGQCQTTDSTFSMCVQQKCQSQCSGGTGDGG